MCGIGGITYFVENTGLEVELNSLMASQRHRGPDDKGIWMNGKQGFCHTRLAIVDPDHAHQPMEASSGEIVVFNGEIYNYKEIRQQLKSARFHTQSDTEVLLQSYHYWGVSCLQRFQGMFAFAVLDPRKHKLFLARDRVGIKPLYYYYDNERFAFASELTALLQLQWVPRKVNEKSLWNYFKFGYIPSPNTIYHNIYKLPPAYYMEVDIHKGEISLANYWKLRSNRIWNSENQWQERLEAKLDNLVNLYSRSDAPIGCFLSGGVDSSLVSAIAKTKIAQPLRTFTAGFNEDIYSELKDAETVSSILKTTHSFCVVSPKYALDRLPKIATHFGEPFCDSSAIPTLAVAELAKRNAKVLLSGDGGDELFAGYNSYQNTWREMTNPFFPILCQLSSLFSLFSFGQLGTSLSGLKGNWWQKHLLKRQIFNDDELKILLAENFGSSHSYDSYLKKAPAGPDLLSRCQLSDFYSYLPEDVLTKVDRMSMAASVEVRVPLLDHEIVEFAFNMSSSQKIRCQGLFGRKKTMKYPLRLLLSSYFPEKVVKKQKQGFGIPIGEWCRGPMREIIEDQLTSSSIETYLDKVEVKRVLAAAINQGKHIPKLWSLFMFALWMVEVDQSKEIRNFVVQ